MVTHKQSYSNLQIITRIVSWSEFIMEIATQNLRTHASLYSYFLQYSYSIGYTTAPK